MTKFKKYLTDGLGIFGNGAGLMICFPQLHMSPIGSNGLGP